MFNAGTGGKCNPRCVTAPSGLAGWWGGDDNPFDLSANNDHGTIVGSVPFAGGKVGDAFSFSNSIANYVSIPDNAALDLTQFTVDAWVFPTGNIAGFVIDKEGNSGINYVISAGGGAAEIDFNPADHQFVDSPPGSVPDNTWTHITGTYDGPSSKTLKLYINGVLVGTHVVGDRLGDQLPIDATPPTTG